MFRASPVSQPYIFLLAGFHLERLCRNILGVHVGSRIAVWVQKFGLFPPANAGRVPSLQNSVASMQRNRECSLREADPLQPPLTSAVTSHHAFVCPLAVSKIGVCFSGGMVDRTFRFTARDGNTHLAGANREYSAIYRLFGLICASMSRSMLLKSSSGLRAARLHTGGMARPQARAVKEQR